MPTFPLPSLKFRTVGFPQYRLQGQPVRCDLPTRHATNRERRHPAWSSTRDSFVITLRMRPLPISRPGSESWSSRRFSVPLCKRLCLSTPGVLGSRTSSVVSRAHCVLRPHPSVPQARDDFTAWPLIRRAFAVRVRLGDPRDFPYFRDRYSPGVPSTIRRWVRDAVPLLVRTPMPGCLALSPSRHPRKPASASNIRRGVLFERGIVRFMLRPVWLPSPPDWLRPDDVTCAPPGLPRTLSLPLWTLPVTGPRWESG